MSKTSVPEEGGFHYQSKTGSYHYVKKTGYMVKSPSTSRIGRWRKRWFMLVDSVEPGVLTGTPERQIRLEYYSVAPMKMRNLTELPKRKGMIDLRPCIAVVANEDKIKGYKNIINIVMSSFRVHHLVAESLKERDEWVLALTEFVFSRTKSVEDPRKAFKDTRKLHELTHQIFQEANNYFTRPRVKRSVYTDFLTSSYYYHSKDDQFLSSHTKREGTSHHQCNTESDGEWTPPIMVPRGQYGGKSSLQRTLSHQASLCEGAGKGMKKSFKSCRPSFHEDPEETGGLLQIQLSNWNMTMISRSDIQIGETITTGCFKKTSHGMCHTVGSGEQQQVIVKTALRDPTSIMKEGLTIWQMMHPNIIMLVGAVLIDNPKHIVLECCGRGTLLNVLQEHGRLLEKGATKSSELKSTLLKYCKQISLGLGYLKGKEIAHGAIKASNIFVSNEDTCKISGFGESLSLKDGSCHQLNPNFELSVEWTAPEAYSSKTYTTASDIWSVGIVLYEIWSLGYQPYQGMAKEEIMPRLIENYRLPPPPGVSKDIYRLIIEMWHPKPEKRPMVESLVTFLVQPEEDLLHMNQLPKKSSQKAYSAHTLGAPISSGELLYRDLQLTYIEFIEEAKEKSPKSEYKITKRESTESCSYIEIGDILQARTLRKFAATRKIPDDDDNDVYWNDPYWSNSALPLQNVDAPSPQQSSPEHNFEQEESDIYWNDPFLPPLSTNICMDSRKEEENCGRGEENISQVEPPLHQVHTQTLKKLWSVTNMSSSEDEGSLPLASKVKRKRGSSKHVCANKLPSASCSHDSSTCNSSDSDSNVLLRNLCDSDNMLEKPRFSNRKRCSSIPVLPIDEREWTNGYYNASALEVMEQISRSSDMVMYPPSDPHSLPRWLPNSSQAEPLNQRSSSLNVTYSNLEAMKADSCPTSQEGNTGDNHNYYNSSVMVETIPSTIGDQELQVKEVTEYYNSSATVVSLSTLDDQDKQDEKEYYNPRTALQSVLPPASANRKKKDEVTHEYSSTMALEVLSSAVEQDIEPPPGYYNSSAVEMFSGGLLRNPENFFDQHLVAKTGKSKSTFPKYYNLEFFDSDDENPPENSNSQNSKEQKTDVPQPQIRTYCNLLDTARSTFPNSAEDVDKNSEFEESCIREDIRELLRVRSQNSNGHPLANNENSEAPSSTYYNLKSTISRATDQSGEHTQPQTIVHITPPYGSASKRHKKPKPSVRYVHKDKHKTSNELEGEAGEKQSKKENYQRTRSRKEASDATMLAELEDNSCKHKEVSSLAETPISLCVSTETHDKGVHCKRENVDCKVEGNGEKSIPNKKQVHTSHRHNHSSAASSPTKGSSQSPTSNLNRSPNESRSPSPSLSPSKRKEKVLNSTIQNPHRKIRREDDTEKPSRVNHLRTSGKQFQEVVSGSKLEHTTSAVVTTSDRPPASVKKGQKDVLEQDKTVDESSSSGTVMKMMSEPKGTSIDTIKTQLTKVLSYPHIPPSNKTRPSPPPKTAAVINAASKRPPVAKKPMVGTTSLSGLVTCTANTATVSTVTGNGSNELAGGGSKTDRVSVAVVNHSPVDKQSLHHKALHNSPSETSSAQWQRQTKKPLLPPSRGGNGCSVRVKN